MQKKIEEANIYTEKPQLVVLIIMLSQRETNLGSFIQFNKMNFQA